MIISIRNMPQINKKNKERVTQIHTAITEGLRIGIREYEGYVISKMLSGRRGKTGLNRISGMAANSLDVKISRGDGYFIGNLTVNRRAWYLKVHQHYNFTGYIYPKTKKFLSFKIGDKFIKTKRVYIPKRLYMIERFKTVGTRYIRNRIIEQIGKMP